MFLAIDCFPDRLRLSARTVADLSGGDAIEPAHIGEAVQLRCLDRSPRG
jgi:predicted ATPase with chaperone activity